jgi:hypothetical protein
MTAFLELLNTYAIFFYIAGVIAVLFGIKMLFDARRASRTTLFTLEQEQASDRAFRAVLVMLGATLFIGAVAGINAFVAPVVPGEETPTEIAAATIPFTPPVTLRTATPQPTLTTPPPTAGAETAPPVATTNAVNPTAAPVQPPAATTAPQPTVPPTVPAESPTAVPQPTAEFGYAAPTLNTPPNGDSIGSERVRMSWGVDEFGNQSVPQMLPQDQFYRLAITFTDKNTNVASTLVLCTHESSADTRTGVTVAEYRNEAVDNLFTWTVQVVQSASQEACQAGQYQPLSPTSSAFQFRLP